MIGDFIVNNNTVTHRKPRDYDRINGFRPYRDPITAANGEARRAANKEARLIKAEERREILQEVWDVLYAREKGAFNAQHA